MINLNLGFRLKAFYTHLSVSIGIALLSIYIVLIVWHPAPLDKAVGVTSLFLMMIAIDAILGPILTLVVAKPDKKSLKLDLFVIIIIQLIAYIYGMYSISVNRPVYIAFDTNRFEVVQAGDISKSSSKSAVIPYSILGYAGPNWVAIKPSKDADEQSRRIMEEMGNGIAPSMQPIFYEPLFNQWDTIERQAKPVHELRAYNSEKAVNNVMINYPTADSWLPMKAFNLDMVVLLDTDINQVVDTVDLRGW